MTPEEVKTMLPCWGEADWCRDMRNCVCKQNIEAAIRAAYEDAAKIAEKVGGHDLGNSYITPRIADAIRARIS
jgi:hypothetical protein